MTKQEAAAEWGEGTTEDTMASNSRVRAKRARRELDWQPQAAKPDGGDRARVLPGAGQAPPFVTPSHHAQVPDINW